MGFFDAIVKPFTKVAEALDTGARKAGDKIVETKVGKVVADIAKSAIVIPNESYKSITGKDLANVKAETVFGKNLIGVNQLGIQSGHTALKAFANTVTGGLAEKAHVKLVEGYDPKAPQEKIFTSGVLAKAENFIDKASPIIGALGPSLLKGGASEQQKQLQKTGQLPMATPPPAPQLLAAPPSSFLQQAVSTTPKAATNTVTNLVSNITKPDNMSFLSNASSFLQTDAGKAVQGVLGNVVTNLLTPKPQPSPAPQNAVFAQTALPPVNDKKTSTVQDVLFGEKGIIVQTPGTPTQRPGWWSENKAWALPVFVVAGVFAVLATLAKLLFGRRRR